MMRKKKTINLLLGVFVILYTSSCSTILNSRYTGVTVHMDTTGPLSPSQKNIYSAHEKKEISTPRSSQPLKITLQTDSIRKTIFIQPFHSPVYWVNVFTYGIGFFIDNRSGKRFTYPENVYVDMKSPGEKYTTSPPGKFAYPYSNLVKWSPISMVGAINPSVELSYERRISNLFSANLAGSWLLANSVTGQNWHNRGFQLETEFRFYLKKSAPVGPFLSLSVGHLDKKYVDSVSFGKTGSESQVMDNEDFFYNYYTRIKKRSTYFRINYGVQYQLSLHWLLSWRIGLGNVESTVHYLNRPNQTDPYIDRSGPDPNIYRNINQEGTHDKTTFSAYLKVAYAF